MDLSAIYHSSAFTDCYALDAHRVVLNIRTGKDVTKVNLIHEDPFTYGIAGDNPWKGIATPMCLSKELKYCNIWSVTVIPQFKRLQYYFEVFCGEEKLLKFEDDFYTEEAINKNGRWKQYYKFPWLNPSDVIEIPQWVSRTVWYQIMPDRFCRGDKMPKRMKLKAWDDRETVTGKDFYGGDLRGIIEKLSYLKGLGISGIYLLPVFLSNTNHKYNTFDYTKIDPDFGTEEDMKELVSRAHDLGIRVMLDAVFNHSGVEFFPWKDVWEKGEASAYFDWFCINEKPFRPVRGSLKDGRYYGFAFLDTMPKLNTNNPQVMQYFEDLCAYWIEKWHIDGIRFDVGNEISHTFIKCIHKRMKAIQPEIFLLGEIWHDSIQWLQGDEYDSVMNYPFMESMHNFWVDGKSSALDFRYAMNRVYAMYPKQIERNIFNFLDTHDTLRALNRCGSLDVFYQQLAILLTMPGSACIYYGTEIAMPGGNDPDCRRTMPWKEIEAGIHEDTVAEVKKLIALRNENPQLTDTEILWDFDPVNTRLIMFGRPGENGEIWIYLNGGNENVDLRITDKILYTRKYNGTELAPGGILVFCK